MTEALESPGAVPAERAPESPTELLTALWGDSHLAYRCVAVKFPGTHGFSHRWFTSTADAIEYIEHEATDLNAEVYHACAIYDAPAVDAAQALDRAEHGKSSSSVGRKAENVIGSFALWCDVDVKPEESGSAYPNIQAAIAGLRDFAAQFLKPSFVVGSGSGVHVYWVADEFMDRATLAQLSNKLKQHMVACGFQADPSRTADIASVLRPPGTKNRKQEEPRKVTCRDTGFRYRIDDFVRALAHANSRQNVASEKAEAGDALLLDNELLPETDENIRRVVSALDSIDPDIDYPTWFRCLCALHSTKWERAPRLAHEWSSRGAKFSGQSFEKAWESIQPRADGITIRSLFRLAHDAGWRGETCFVREVSADGIAHSDLSMARALAKRCRGRILYVQDVNRWLRFDSETNIWRDDVHAPVCEAKQLADDIRIVRARAVRELAANDPRLKQLEKLHVKIESRRGIEDTVVLMRSEVGISRSLADFDTSLRYVGAQNGVLDLNRRLVQQPPTGVLVTKQLGAAFDPHAVSPSWDAFLRHAVPDDGVRAFLQRWAGASLLGVVPTLRVLVFLIGRGANGKTVFLRTLQHVMGEYATTTDVALLTETQKYRIAGRATPDRLALRGIRLAVSSETEEGSAFNESVVKALTGNETVAGRALYSSDWVEFEPTHALAIAGNHRPRIAGRDHGIWSRVHLVPFETTIPRNRQDPGLLCKLKEEASGVLNWILDGAADFENRGCCLDTPAVIERAVEDYRSEMDVIGQWLVEHTTASPGAVTPLGDLYRAFRRWAKEQGIDRITNAAGLARELGDRGYPAGSGRARRSRCGIKLNAAGDAALRLDTTQRGSM